jgi:four helix bundle protein
MYSFEKLNTWIEARKLVKSIYAITEKFPAEEKFGLMLQIRRASISVVSNIAEGSARISPKDQAHFSQIAYSSLMEVLNQLIIANDLNFISNEVLEETRLMIDSLANKIAALRNSQLKRINLKP